MLAGWKPLLRSELGDDTAAEETLSGSAFFWKCVASFRPRQLVSSLHFFHSSLFLLFITFHYFSLPLVLKLAFFNKKGWSQIRPDDLFFTGVAEVYTSAREPTHGARFNLAARFSSQVKIIATLLTRITFMPVFLSSNGNGSAWILCGSIAVDFACEMNFYRRFSRLEEWECRKNWDARKISSPKLS